MSGLKQFRMEACLCTDVPARIMIGCKHYRTTVVAAAITIMCKTCCFKGIMSIREQCPCAQ